jgi:hypothetical protein
MASRTAVLQSGDVFEVLCGSTAVVAGQLVYNDGTDWELADADASSTGTIYAMAVAISDSPAAGVLKVARKAVLYDIDDNSYSSGTFDTLYCHTTAGAISTTRPTAVNAVVQVVGKAYKVSGGTGSQLAVIDIKGPSEHQVTAGYKFASSANLRLDSGNFGSGSQDADDEVAMFVTQIPQNAVSIEVAYIWVAAEATAGTPTFELIVGSAIDGAQHDAITADTSLTDSAFEGTAADQMQRTDVTDSFNATNIFRPGALLGIRVNEDGGGTDITFVFDITIVYNVV